MTRGLVFQTLCVKTFWLIPCIRNRLFIYFQVHLSDTSIYSSLLGRSIPWTFYRISRYPNPHDDVGSLSGDVQQSLTHIWLCQVKRNRYFRWAFQYFTAYIVIYSPREQGLQTPLPKKRRVWTNLNVKFNHAEHEEVESDSGVTIFNLQNIQAGLYTTKQERQTKVHIFFSLHFHVIFKIQT